jgi:hypothetical protein
MEEILVEWERSPNDSSRWKAMDSLALRNHAKQILGAVAKDIETAQTEQERAEKSHGLAPVLAGIETAATTPACCGSFPVFNLRQLGSEYRALRASVIRLWKAQLTELRMRNLTT